MKANCMLNKVSGEVSDDKFITQLSSYTEVDEYTSGLDTLEMAEVVKQRGKDALRIKELTLRAIETLEKLNNNINTLCG
ncbi:hypothetical protein ES703_24169 [subsurface metagenome]